jgi:hypothetical protein
MQLKAPNDNLRNPGKPSRNVVPVIPKSNLVSYWTYSQVLTWFNWGGGYLDKYYTLDFSIYTLESDV